MREKDPGAAEHPPLLELVDLGVAVQLRGNHPCANVFQNAVECHAYTISSVSDARTAVRPVPRCMNIRQSTTIATVRPTTSLTSPGAIRAAPATNDARRSQAVRRRRM